MYADRNSSAFPKMITVNKKELDLDDFNIYPDFIYSKIEIQELIKNEKKIAKTDRERFIIHNKTQKRLNILDFTSYLNCYDIEVYYYS